MAHTVYDELYHTAYVPVWPTQDTSDAQSDFEWRWLRRVTEPLLLGYAFAKPDNRKWKGQRMNIDCKIWISCTIGT